MTTANKRIAKAGKVSSKENPLPQSIKYIEERPDLNNYLTGKALSLKTETVMKQSLADHLHNPYIYISKVLNKNRANYFLSANGDWDTSCNMTSLRRPKTRGGPPVDHDHDSSPESEKEKSPKNKSQSPGRQESPKRLNSKKERKEAYEENAHLRNFVYQFFEKIYRFILSRQYREEHSPHSEEEESRKDHKRKKEEIDSPEDLKIKFEKFVKDKKVTFEKNDNDKCVDEKTFTSFVKFLLGKQEKLLDRIIKRRMHDEDEYLPQKEVKEEEPLAEDVEIQKFFKHFAENKGTEKKPLLKISLKAFMFNYKKYLTNKYKIRYPLSEKAAKQRNVDIKIYIRDFLASFDMIRSYLNQIKEKELSIASSIIAYDIAGRPTEGGVSLMEHFNQLTTEKEKLIFERKVLVRFLDLHNKKYPDFRISLATLNFLVEHVIREEKSNDLTLLGNFIHEFKREKHLFKEDLFNTFEMVNFIQEKKYTRAQFEILSYFIGCLRKAYNRSKNLPKADYVDPRTPIPNSLLSSTFEQLCKKAEAQNMVLDHLLEDLTHEFEKHRVAETDRILTIIEHNVLGDFILKKFNSLDNNLLGVLDKMEELGNYLENEDIDHHPMEEIREKVYYILTGNELKERIKENVKPLTGFTRMLKGKEPIAKKVDQHEEQRKLNRERKEKTEESETKEIKKIPDTELDEFTRLYRGERKEELDKEKGQDKKEADDDWTGLIDGKYTKINKLKKEEKEAREDDETDQFITLLNPKKGKGRKEDHGEFDFKEPRHFQEDKDDKVRRHHSSPFSFDAPEKEKKEEKVDDFVKMKYEREAEKNAQNRRNEEVDSYLKMKVQNQYKYSFEPEQKEFDPRDPRRFQETRDDRFKHQQSSPFSFDQFSKDSEMKVQNQYKYNFEPEQKEFDPRDPRRFQETRDDRFKYQQSSPFSFDQFSKDSKERKEENVDDFIKIRNEREAEKEKYSQNKRNEEVDNYLKMRVQNQYKYDIEADLKETKKEDQVEEFLRMRRLEESEKEALLNKKSDVDDYLRRRQQFENEKAKGSQSDWNKREDFAKSKNFEEDDMDNFISMLNSKPGGNDPKKNQSPFAFLGKSAEKSPQEHLEGYSGFMNNLKGTPGLNVQHLDSDDTKRERELPSFRSTFLETLKGSVKIEKEREKEQLKSQYIPESPEKERIKNALLQKNEKLSKVLDDCQDPNYLTKSTLKGRTDDAVVLPETVNLGKDKPKMGRFSDYEMLLPADYYAFLAKKNVEMDKDPWYIRSHHIETLTEHPKSVKDNLLGAEYVSYYSALPKDEKLIAKEKEIVGYSDKDHLISSLEENRRRLKEELDHRLHERNVRKETIGASHFKDSKGLKEISKYYDTRELKEGPELMVKAYEGILDDLRNQEKNLLNIKRGEKLVKVKLPPHKWWELKDKTFIDEYIKHVFMTNSAPDNVEDYVRHVEELSMKELI